MAALDRKKLWDGKFDRAEIMRRAWTYVANPFCTRYRDDFKGALAAAWVDAKLVADEANQTEMNFPNKGLSMSDLRPSGRMNNFMYGI